MLDVLHFFFEDDIISITSAEQSDALDSTRVQIYSTLYNREYRHASQKNKRSYIGEESIGKPEDDLEYDDMPTPLDPAERSSSPFVAKPYIPPTKVNSESRLPFGTALDGPLG